MTGRIRSIRTQEEADEFNRTRSAVFIPVRAPVTGPFATPDYITHRWTCDDCDAWGVVEGVASLRGASDEAVEHIHEEHGDDDSVTVTVVQIRRFVSAANREKDTPR